MVCWGQGYQSQCKCSHQAFMPALLVVSVSRSGTQSIVHRYKADQVIGFLQDIAAAVILNQDQDSTLPDDLGEVKQSPMFAGKWDNSEQCPP